MKIKSAANNNNDIAAGVITVNNFFAYLIKEIYIKWYGDILILPLTYKVSIYRYSDEMLKHMPEKALKTIENDLRYSKKS